VPQTPRILIVGLNYSPEKTGIAPYTASMASGLSRCGFQVRAITAHPHYPEWRILPGYGRWSQDEHLSGVSVRRLRHFVPSNPRAARRLLSELSFGVRAVLTRWSSPSLVVVVSPALFASAMVALRVIVAGHRVPIVVWVQDLYALGMAETGQGGRLASRVTRWVERWLLRAADAVVVIHDRFAERIEQDFDVQRDRITTVRNWTHLPAMSPPDVRTVRARYGWADDDIVVLHSGNMGVKQGLHNVVQAAARAASDGSHLRFVMMGDGSKREEMVRLAEQLGAPVQFLPSQRETDFIDAIQSADVLLVNELPGVSEMAVPSKLTSYFAAGRPVVAATDTDGITAGEIRSARAGVVVPAGDARALVEAAAALGADASKARRLGQNAREYQRSVLSETNAIDQFATLLSRLIDGDGAGKHDTHRTTID
jgi:colanic acid biosynthesis glycosyl transferase WcaI